MRWKGAGRLSPRSENGEAHSLVTLVFRQLRKWPGEYDDCWVRAFGRIGTEATYPSCDRDANHRVFQVIAIDKFSKKRLPRRFGSGKGKPNRFARLSQSLEMTIEKQWVCVMDSKRFEDPIPKKKATIKHRDASLMVFNEPLI